MMAEDRLPAEAHGALVQRQVDQFGRGVAERPCPASGWRWLAPVASAVEVIVLALTPGATLSLAIASASVGRGYTGGIRVASGDLYGDGLADIVAGQICRTSAPSSRGA